MTFRDPMEKEMGKLVELTTLYLNPNVDEGDWLEVAGKCTHVELVFMLYLAVSQIAALEKARLRGVQ